MENSNGRKNNKVLIILVIALSLVVIGLGGWIIYNKFFTNSATSKILFVNRQVDNKISVGDEISIGGENFYVINSDDNITSVISKYNLMVGYVLDVNEEAICDETEYSDECYTDISYKFNKELTNQDKGYGLQSQEAKGWYEHTKQLVGIVPFSEAYYWWYSSNITEKPDYNTNTMYNIYDKSLSKVSPKVNVDEVNDVYKWVEHNDYVNDYKGYSIAYYVEQYVTKLIELGAPQNITGRLLKSNEALKLGCYEKKYESEMNSYKEGNCTSEKMYDDATIVGNAPAWLYSSSYWLGSADMSGSHNTSIDFKRVYFISTGGDISSTYYIDNQLGVRPVLDIPTKELN